MFQKSIFLYALSNSVKLIDALTEANLDRAQNSNSSSNGSMPAISFNNDQNDNDRLWQTLNAIIYQRNFLYSMFERANNEKRTRVGETLH